MKRRWIVCGFLFLVTANNYFDRQVFGILAPELIRIFHWKNVDYADIVTWFDIAYAIGFLVSGKVLDVIGNKLGLSLAVGGWSLVSMAHAVVESVTGFKVVRALLGLTEAAHLPAAIKVVAEWFPPEERALATGIYKAGGEIGAIVVPLLVPWLYLRFGWQWAFVLTGATGLLWVAAWLIFYRTGDRPAEVKQALPWGPLLKRSETYGYIAAKFLTDAVWHWYLYLLPLFLSLRFHLSIKQFGPPLVVVYAISDAGSVGGGWLSSTLMKRGWKVTPARKLAMLVCCLCVLPVIFAPHVDWVWGSVVLVGVAMAAHQGWTSNLFTTVSDLYPQGAVGSVVGIGGAVGMVGAALLAQLTGHELAAGGDFSKIFLLAGLAYPAAFAIFYWLAPRLDPIPEEVLMT